MRVLRCGQSINTNNNPYKMRCTSGILEAHMDKNLDIEASFKSSSSNPGKKIKRVRSAFTTNQVKYLEEHFQKCPYINRESRFQLATKLDLSERAIKIWFQNRRMKEKHMNFDDIESRSRILNHHVQNCHNPLVNYTKSLIETNNCNQIKTVDNKVKEHYYESKKKCTSSNLELNRTQPHSTHHETEEKEHKHTANAIENGQHIQKTTQNKSDENGFKEVPDKCLNNSFQRKQPYDLTTRKWPKQENTEDSETNPEFSLNNDSSIHLKSSKQLSNEANIPWNPVNFMNTIPPGMRQQNLVSLPPSSFNLPLLQSHGCCNCNCHSNTPNYVMATNTVTEPDIREVQYILKAVPVRSNLGLNFNTEPFQTSYYNSLNQGPNLYLAPNTLSVNNPFQNFSPSYSPTRKLSKNEPQK